MLTIHCDGCGKADTISASDQPKGFKDIGEVRVTIQNLPMGPDQKTTQHLCEICFKDLVNRVDASTWSRTAKKK